jgi:tetratricopeptide (TPR) repeat protein
MDRVTLQPGEDFPSRIESALQSCEILIAVIGQGWLTTASGSPRRIDAPGDLVRREISIGLNREIRVIPVLVDKATMPKATELPVDLARLANCQAVELTDGGWDRDVEHLVSSLQKELTVRRKVSRKFLTLVVLMVLVIGALSLWWWRPHYGQRGANSANQEQGSGLRIKGDESSPATQQSVRPFSNQNDELTKREVDDAISRGNQQRDAKRYGEAEQEYRRALAINPNEARAYDGLGNVLYDQKLFDRARTEFKRAVQLNPHDAQSHYGLGLVYLMTNKNSDAMDEYRALRTLKSVYANALFREIKKH